MNSSKRGRKACKLGDVVQINYGKGLPEQKRRFGKVPVFSSAGITGWHDTPLVKSAGIILGRKGTIGTVYYSDKPFFCIDTAYYIEPNELKYNLRYLFYLLQTLGLKDLNEDSAVPGLNRNTAYDQDIILPSLSEQCSIAGVLSSLDDKIDLLHRQNKTLESLAETLWRKMFIEDADPKWGQGVLGDLVAVSTGKGLRRNEYIENGIYPVIGANGEIGRTDNYLTEEKLILTGRVGTLGELFINYNQRIWISDNVLIIQSKRDKYFYFTYFFLKEVEFENLNVGSTQPLVTQTDLKKIECSIPDDLLVGVFQDQCASLFDKIQRNINQIRTLSNLRDTLLPKLMSGEVIV